jgi:hypothetical protein
MGGMVVVGAVEGKEVVVKAMPAIPTSREVLDDIVLVVQVQWYNGTMEELAEDLCVR